ncbi:aldehyde dehydrogenase [Aureitalea marina]|uniref:2-hydroxymuconic semialdehyde dehydrogenase n=1 Tax=Aureitalea marina TaxID=930804 RepID=A0A2S7KMD1_9FLAO|nr:aldehyde dehydrogenase [Aureitalea marina]PQB03751.1 2-hydroxymuconic semialdehyde dehydrogenase [Aureitalea marina]
MLRLKNYINGNYQDPADNNWMDLTTPASGDIYAQLAKSNQADIESAYAAASSAFKQWSETTLEERSRIMLKIADLIEKHAEELASAESKDNGKPVWLAAAVDIPRASANFRFYAHALTQFASESHNSTGKNTINFTLRQPIGVVGCISPWNLPLYLFSWKVAPAIAAGNTVVAKPSEVTPYTAYLLGDILTQAGLPAGVLNIVHGIGPEAGQALVEHPGIRAISFTGGTQTGKLLAATAAPMFKKLSLELGGKNPNIIFADCNFERMMQVTLRSSFANQGQICLCGSRILIQRTIYDRFKEEFVKRVDKMTVGNPEEQVDLGAIVSKDHLQKVLGYIELAVEEGGTVLSGGIQVIVPGFENGFYLRPTVIELPDDRCRVNQEEIFGPVVTLIPFDTEGEALNIANGVPYGLSATLWSRDLDRCMRMSKALEAGIVWVNTWLNRDLRTPFGGVKQSGVGREGGFEALRFFTEPKNVCIEYQ